ncbi:cardiolipin synthase [Lacticaseibacillus baoqingensis]|uniref:Cardiolipin synthase n=1 Tax=Lacticaseibacillus baoqingensis TaxID=2486013 RepID=A0ABW4E7I1_9LACO|nr:cardiolipin synthase [Lacticaseibacillus baoqingensis]
MSIVTWLLISLLVINTLGAIFTVLRSVRDISTTWAWLLVLLFLPGLGFLIYLFAGRRLSAKKMRLIQAAVAKGSAAFVQLQKRANAHGRLLPTADLTPAAQELINLFLNTARAPVLTNKSVQLYYDGPKKFAALFEDIAKATDYIYVEYYTIYNDALGNQLRDLLIQKAQAGVRVRVLYDAWGSMGASARWWRPLVVAGGQAETYFSSKHLFLDFRLNYRLHRKLVIIDDAIGYIGGFNVGDQYVSRAKKFGFWRDTHLRVMGNTVMALKIQFTSDWNATVSQGQLPYPNRPLAVDQPTSQNAMQIVASGPESSGQQIKAGYVKLITSATKTVWIQTPYLIPDETVYDALMTAALAGIDVRVMIPNMPDHPFIFRATQYYAAQLTAVGVKIYHYQKGFLHAKTMVVDDRLASVGSANLDIRSFKLNFEANAFIYDPTVAHQLTVAFEHDLVESLRLTPKMIAEQSHWLHFKQRFSRLLSPIL